MIITFIGGGNMASAMLGGLIAQGFAKKELRVVEISEESRGRIEAQFQVPTFAEPASVMTETRCVVLAVKPQQMYDAAVKLRSLLQDQLVITIAAGIRTDDLSNWLGGYKRIVRVMPNTPALIRAGISGLYAMPSVSVEERGQAQLILEAVGSVIWFTDERQLDAVTAISGSGPAYVFYFIEALQQAALELGISRNEAKKLVLDTFLGAAKLAQQSTDEPQTLRAQVTSKGGTTEQAVQTMENLAVKQSIIEAARKAAQRSVELGEQLGKRN